MLNLVFHVVLANNNERSNMDFNINAILKSLLYVVNVYMVMYKLS